MAQEFEEKDMTVEQYQIHDDPLHDVKEQIESGVGTIGSQPLFEGAGQGEKLPETRVGESLLTDNVRKLDSTEPSAMDTDEAAAPEERVVKSEVAETFASEYKQEPDGSGDKKDESVSDDAESVKAGASGDDSLGTQEQGMKFKKLTGAGLPRGKPHFRVSSNQGNRGLGDSSLQSGGPGGGLGGSGGLRGGSRGGLARTGSGLARTGSGIPQGNNDLKDFSAAFLESDTKSSEPSPPPSTDAKFSSEEKPDDFTMFDKATDSKDTSTDELLASTDDLLASTDDLLEPSVPPSEDTKLSFDDKLDNSTTFHKASETKDDASNKFTETKDAAAGKLAAARDATTEKMTMAKEMFVEKATTAKDVVVEKAGDLKTGIVATLKDQLLPVKDSDVSTSNMDVDKTAPAK